MIVVICVVILLQGASIAVDGKSTDALLLSSVLSDIQSVLASDT